MDELDEKLQEMASGYHEPPTPPRELMWARIQARRMPPAPAERTPAVLPFRPRPAAPVRRIAAWSAATAAMLLLGVAIGRSTRTDHPPAPDVASAAVAGNARSNAALQAAVQAHLRQTEAYLSLFRASVRSGETDDLAVPTARELLASNRFLVSAPGTDPKLRALLLDVELVLVGITQLQASDRPADIQLITDGLDEAGMLTRLRSAAPRDSRPLPTGVL